MKFTNKSCEITIRFGDKSGELPVYTVVGMNCADCEKPFKPPHCSPGEMDLGTYRFECPRCHSVWNMEVCEGGIRLVLIHAEGG